MIGKLEKLETCIRLADKMDNMDRTWRWFINPFFRMCNSKVKDLLEFVNHENSKVRIVIRVSRKVVYYLVIAMVAYITTRDQGDYYAESDWSNIETHVAPAYYYKWVWFTIVFLVMLM